MTTAEVDTAMEVAEEQGMTVEQYGPYNGRGMFGDTTEALIVSPDDVDRLLDGLEQRDIAARVDSMGLDFVVY